MNLRDLSPSVVFDRYSVAGKLSASCLACWVLLATTGCGSVEPTRPYYTVESPETLQITKVDGEEQSFSIRCTPAGYAGDGEFKGQVKRTEKPETGSQVLIAGMAVAEPNIVRFRYSYHSKMPPNKQHKYEIQAVISGGKRARTLEEATKMAEERKGAGWGTGYMLVTFAIALGIILLGKGAGRTSDVPGMKPEDLPDAGQLTLGELTQSPKGRFVSSIVVASFCLGAVLLSLLMMIKGFGAIGSTMGAIMVALFGIVLVVAGVATVATTRAAIFAYRTAFGQSVEKDPDGVV